MQEPQEDFLTTYLQYTIHTECPMVFHRWTALSVLGAWIGRDISFEFGHFNLYPNIYCLFIADAGTRKTTAIKIGQKLITRAGYKTFAAQKTRQEKYLEDLYIQSTDSIEILDQNLWGNLQSEDTTESYISADEFGNFIGAGNLDFMSILGELWDYEGVYKYKLKNSKDVFIPNPSISILGGITATEFNRVFPQEALGQGFFSRLLIVHDEPTGVKLYPPPTPDKEIRDKLLAQLGKIKESMQGQQSIIPEADNLLNKIYKSWPGIPDARFEHYTNRRLTHLIKLCMLIAASRLSMEISVEDVVRGNTMLTMLEHFMPTALGEFGKGRHSDVTHKVIKLLNSSSKMLSFKQLWQHIHTDLDKRDQLNDILYNLVLAEKIQYVVTGDTGGYLGVRKVMKETLSEALDWEILTDCERKLLGKVKIL